MSSQTAVTAGKITQLNWALHLKPGEHGWKPDWDIVAAFDDRKYSVALTYGRSDG